MLGKHFYFTKFKNNFNNIHIEKINNNIRTSSTKNKNKHTIDNISEYGNSLKNNTKIVKNELIDALEENDKVNNK